MADFEKVYSINYNVSKALESLRKLEKVLVRVDTRSRELFQAAAGSEAFERVAKAAKKAEKATSRAGASAKKSVDSTAAAVNKGLTPSMIAFQKKRDQMMRGLGATAQQTKKAVDSTTKATKRGSAETTAFQKSLGKFAKKVNQINKKAADQSQKQVRRGAKSLATDIGKQTRAMERLLNRAKKKSETSWAAITKATDRTRAAFDATNKANARAMKPKGERRKARDIRAIGAAGGFAAQSMSRMAAKLTIFLSAAAGIRDVLGEYRDFNQSATSAAAKFSRVEPQLRPGTEGFKQFSKEIRLAGLGTEHSAAAVSQAVDFWAKAGKTSEQSKAVLDNTLAFASANQDASGSMLDVSRAGDILSDTLGQFKLNSDDTNVLMANTARVSDVMSAAANRANMSAEELFEAFTSAGPTLSSVGSDIEETSSLLAAMANAGIKGASAGTQLKMSISNLSAMTGPQEAAMAKLGVTVKDADGNFRGLTTIIRDLNVATKDMGTGDRFQVFAKAVGRRAIPSFINLLAEGKTNLDGMSEALREAGGETNRLAEQMRSSIGARIETTKNGLREFGFAFLDATGLADGFGSALSGIDWKSAAANVYVVADAVRSFFEQIPGYASEAFTAVTTEFSQFITLFETSISKASRLFSGFARGWSSEWDTTFGHLSALGETLLETYGGVFQEFKELVYELTSVFFGGADGVETRWAELGETLGINFAEVVQFISAMIGTIAQVAGAVFSSVLEIVTTVIQNIKSIFSGLFSGILAIAEGDFLGGMKRIGLAIADAITLPFRAAINGLLKLVQKIPGAEALAESFGINLEDMQGDVSGGLTKFFEEPTPPTASAIPEVGFAPAMQQTEIPEVKPAMSVLPEVWEIPETPAFDMGGLQNSLDLSAAQETQNAEALTKMVDLLADDAKRQDTRAAETRQFEQTMTKSAAAGSKTINQNVTVGPTSIKVEAHGASVEDVERAARRAVSDAGRSIKRDVMDGIRSEGPAEI